MINSTRINKKIFLAAAIIIAVALTPTAWADTLGQSEDFFVNSSYDSKNRSQLRATLRNVSDHAYFYIEDSFWDSLGGVGRNRMSENLQRLANDFDQSIYLEETRTWGSENKPGVDNDVRVTILIHSMKTGTGGYFETVNTYPRHISPGSNSREMVAISSNAVLDSLSSARSFLAHEFQHLISFHQKETLRGISEDIWLNELRSEYSISLGGFNQPFDSSTLKQRMNVFVRSTNDSLVEWLNQTQDYSSVALFGEYLVEQYGAEILAQSLRSNLSGIDSINAYLASKGFTERFNDIYSNWLIALAINNRGLNPDFGYIHTDLAGIRVEPDNTGSINSIEPFSVIYTSKPYQPQWHRFVVDRDLASNFHLKITGPQQFGQSLAYVDNLGRKRIINDEVYLPKDSGLSFFYIMPINHARTSGFGVPEDYADIPSQFEMVETLPDSQTLKDGMLIRKIGQKEIYVIEGRYKRYLSPEVISLYGHLDASKAVELSDELFSSYISANYVRYINEKKVYAIWPDNTKHWLNMTGEYFTQSGRDWNSIFIINELELDFYQTGPDITR